MSLANDSRERYAGRWCLLSLELSKLLRLCVTIGLFSCASTVSALNPETGRIDRLGDQAVLIVDAPRPVNSAAITLAQGCGIAVSVEDLPYVFQDDVKDVLSEVSRTARPSRRMLIPRGAEDTWLIRALQ